MPFRGYSISIKGKSHESRGTPCQDSSDFVLNSRGYAVAVVSDGHGSARHFRSDVGSKYATNVSREISSDIAKEFKDRNAFLKALRCDPERTMRRMTDGIITKWSDRVISYDEEHPLTEGERNLLVEAEIAESEWGDQPDDPDAIAKRLKRYGCTLICCIMMDEAMLAFQIGDGALVAVNVDGEESMPVPPDEDCFLNRTTSICGSDASERFRHLVIMGGVEDISVKGFRSIPADPGNIASVTVATDGFTTSFNSDESMMRYCCSIPEVLEMESGKSSLEENLTLRSRSNTEDDVSISTVYRFPSIVKHGPSSQEEEALYLESDDCKNRSDLGSSNDCDENGAAVLCDYLGTSDHNNYVEHVNPSERVLSEDGAVLLSGVPLVHEGMCEIPDSVAVIGPKAFCGCISLEKVVVPDSVSEISDWAFYECSGLRDVQLSRSLKLIGKSSFSKCIALKHITIPDGVSSIGWSAFRDCTSLENVEIPDSMRKIEGLAFRGCTSLKVIDLPHCVKIEDITFQDSVKIVRHNIDDRGSYRGETGECQGYERGIPEDIRTSVQ